MNECFGRAIFVIRVPSLIHETKGSFAGDLRYCSVGSFASLNVASYVGWCTPRRVPSPGHARSGGRRGLYMRVNKAFSNIATPFAFKFTSEGDGGGGGSYSSHYMEVSLDTTISRNSPERAGGSILSNAPAPDFQKRRS